MKYKIMTTFNITEGFIERTYHVEADSKEKALAKYEEQEEHYNNDPVESNYEITQTESVDVQIEEL